jgi:hypothetical protein
LIRHLLFLLPVYKTDCLLTSVLGFTTHAVLSAFLTFLLILVDQAVTVLRRLFANSNACLIVSLIICFRPIQLFA